MEEEISERELKRKLAQKIVDLGKSLGAVSTDDRNEYSDYDFITSAKMTALLRGKYPAAGLSIIPEVVDYSERDFSNTNPETGKVSTVTRTIVSMIFEIVDLETGYSVTKNFTGADQDWGGKSMGQAVTGCCKRFYFKLFNVSSKDETDPDSKTTDIPGGGNQHRPSHPTGFGNSAPPDRTPHPAENHQRPAELTENYVNNEWNGKIYGRGEVKSVYVSDRKTTISEETAARLRKHPKYKSG